MTAAGQGTRSKPDPGPGLYRGPGRHSRRASRPRGAADISHPGRWTDPYGPSCPVACPLNDNNFSYSHIVNRLARDLLVLQRRRRWMEHPDARPRNPIRSPNRVRRG